jgi:hypothetical protein
VNPTQENHNNFKTNTRESNINNPSSQNKKKIQIIIKINFTRKKATCYKKKLLNQIIGEDLKIQILI